MNLFGPKENSASCGKTFQEPFNERISNRELLVPGTKKYLSETSEQIKINWEIMMSFQRRTKDAISIRTWVAPAVSGWCDGSYPGAEGAAWRDRF